MDLFAINAVLTAIQRHKSQDKESFTVDIPISDDATKKIKELIALQKKYTYDMGGPYSIWVLFIVSVIAAALSWNCSTVEGRGVFEKLGWSILAFIFGAAYLVYFYLFRESWCRLATARSKGL